MMKTQQRIGVYAGTFDPITEGHTDIIRRSLRVVDRLIVAVALDTGKQPMFSLEERTALVRHDMSALGEDAKRIDVQSFSGLLVNFAKAHHATVLIRGLRAVSDFEYEFQMACMNSKLSPELETIFLTASESTHFVSSRFVKQISRLGGDISGFVSPHVEEALRVQFEQM
jgi:pantetheine-phosphate adenylyltransferase